MADVERSIIPNENGPIYQVKFPDFQDSYLFHTVLWNDITFNFNEDEPHKSYFIKETVSNCVFIQDCEFREMKDISGDPILILGSEKVTDMPFVFVGMANIPTDEECRLAIAEMESGPQGSEMYTDLKQL